MKWVAGIGLVAFVLAGCHGGEMTGYRLGKDADELASIAADGAITAHGTFKGETTRGYTRVHASELGKQAGKLARVAASTHAVGKASRLSKRLVGLSREVSDELEQLEKHPGDRALARELESKFGAAKDEAEKIGKSA